MLHSSSASHLLVVKIGTSTVTRSINGYPHLDPEAFSRIARQLIDLHPRYHPVIVSSAAITAGMEIMRLADRPPKSAMVELKTLASIGNPRLMHAWETAFRPRLVGQLLLTRHSLNTNDIERHEAISVINDMHTHDAIPIVNENDAVTHEEIQFGDNDRLAATLATKLAKSGQHVTLVLLSDVDGVYEDVTRPETVIHRISELARYETIAGDAGSSNGTGGMKSKFMAAEIALNAGISMYIANGKHPDSIRQTLAGKCGTHFDPGSLAD